MAESKLTPLQFNVAITNPDGTPTPYFIQLLQQLYEEKSLTDAAVANAIIAGAGLSGGGDLAAGPVTLSANVQAILNLISTTRGAILYRGAAAWSALLPGTAGFFLKTQGAGADPIWAAAGGGGGAATPVIRSRTGPAYGVFSSINVALPAGTAVGDIVCVFGENGYGGTGWTAGWTLLDRDWGQWTNFTWVAKVIVAADITLGYCQLTFGGSFDGVYGAVCVDGSTVNSIDGHNGASTPGSGSSLTQGFTGLIGAAPTDLGFGFCAMRGNGAATLSSGLTLVAQVNGGSASIAFFTIKPAAFGKLGLSESVTWSAGNNGNAYAIAAFK